MPRKLWVIFKKKTQQFHGLFKCQVADPSITATSRQRRPTWYFDTQRRRRPTAFLRRIYVTWPSSPRRRKTDVFKQLFHVGFSLEMWYLNINFIWPYFYRANMTLTNPSK